MKLSRHSRLSRVLAKLNSRFKAAVKNGDNARALKMHGRLLTVTRVLCEHYGVPLSGWALTFNERRQRAKEDLAFDSFN